LDKFRDDFGTCRWRVRLWVLVKFGSGRRADAPSAHALNRPAPARRPGHGL